MGSASQVLLSPAAEAWVPQQKPVFLSDPLVGKVVAILSNGWTSMNIMTERMAGLLMEKYGVREVLVRELPNNMPPPALVNEVAGRAAAAIVGLAN